MDGISMHFLLEYLLTLSGRGVFSKLPLIFLASLFGLDKGIGYGTVGYGSVEVVGRLDGRS